MSSDTEPIPIDGGDDAEVLDDEPRNILLGIISQLSKGMDLHRVALPTFVLEPRSMLERITDFMSHPDILFTAAQTKDPIQRFVHTLKFYLSGWHIRPKGAKKPYNPVHGEFFRCRWKFDDGSESFYIAEQVSHHPPISAFYYHNPQNRVCVAGEFRPKSKFLGNSAATLMHGGSRIRFLDYPKEEYVVTNPNVYARGILFGTMLLELGDTCTLKCDASDLMAEVEFVTKGYFTGSYNCLKGKIKRQSSGEVLYEISGKWTETIYINKPKGAKETLFDVATSSMYPKVVQPEGAQKSNESRKLWTKLTAALLSRKMDQATQEKMDVEDAQRKIRHDREKEQAEHDVDYFECHDDLWLFKQEKELAAAAPSKAKEILEKTIFSE